MSPDVKYPECDYCDNRAIKLAFSKAQRKYVYVCRTHKNMLNHIASRTKVLTKESTFEPNSWQMKPPRL